MSKQEDNMRNRRGIVYYRLKESTFGKIYVSLYETWKKNQFSLNCHVLNDLKKSIVKLVLDTLKSCCSDSLLAIKQSWTLY